MDKKVVNQQIIRRHFDYTLPSSEEDFIVQLQRDKVILRRNELKQVTLFKKCSSSVQYTADENFIPNRPPPKHYKSCPHISMKQCQILKSRELFRNRTCSRDRVKTQIYNSKGERKIQSEHL